MSRPYGLRGLPAPPIITPASRCSIFSAAMIKLGTGAPASGVSPWSDAANTVLAFPFTIERETSFYKGFWVNGSNAGGNSDVALYDEQYNFIIGIGSTVGSGNSVPQIAAFTATVKLPPGRYYAGMSHSATTTNQVTRWSGSTAGMWQALGCWKFADAPPIAGAATPADYTNGAFPVFGVITRTGFDL